MPLGSAFDRDEPAMPTVNIPLSERERAHADPITRGGNLYLSMASNLKAIVGAPQEAGISFDQASVARIHNGWYEFRVTFKPDPIEGAEPGDR